MCGFSRPALLGPSPEQDAGVEVGDTLQQVDGEHLGSYKQGMALFKKQKGSFKLTVLREDDITIWAAKCSRTGESSGQLDYGGSTAWCVMA